MSADDARDLARWMREVLSATDVAHQDADALDAAAGQALPNADGPGVRIVVDMESWRG